MSHAVVCEDVSHALRANAGCAYREDAETYPVQNMVVRRLTPLECERLQGFPDGWTDIGDYTDSTSKKRKTSDSARYKALGNSIALPFFGTGCLAVWRPICRRAQRSAVCSMASAASHCAGRIYTVPGRQSGQARLRSFRLP